MPAVARTCLAGVLDREAVLHGAEERGTLRHSTSSRAAHGGCPSARLGHLSSLWRLARDVRKLLVLQNTAAAEAVSSLSRPWQPYARELSVTDKGGALEDA